MNAASPGSLSTEGGLICPACGETTALRVDLFAYHLFGCDACGCWSSDARARGAALSFEPTHYFERPEIDRDKWEGLIQRLAARPLRRILDVGCGSGAFLRFAAGRLPGVECTGVELDRERAELARRANPDARIHVGDALDALTHLEPPFDLITLWDVFEHLPAPALALERLAPLLGPDGSLYLQTIHERSVLPTLGRISYRVTGGRLTGAARRTHDAHHLVFFTRTGLQLIAERAGLEIRSLWFDRLARARMDGHPLVTAATSVVLRIENALGNGLFINLILTPAERKP